MKDNIKKLKKKLPYKFIQEDLKNVTALYYYLKAKAAPLLGDSFEDTESFYINAINNTENQTINKKIYYYHQLIVFLKETNNHESMVKYMNEVADLVYV